MALILRTCISGQKRYIGGLANVTQNIIYCKHNSHEKKSTSALQVRQFATKGDKTLEGYSQIYQTSLLTPIYYVKIFSLTTSLGGILAQPILYMKAIETDNTIALVGIMSFIGLFSVLSPLALQWLTKRCIIDLFYNHENDKYIARTYSLFLRKKMLEFTVDDVEVPDITGMFTTCLIKGKPVLIEESAFSNASHYMRFMGYDKPIDFKLGNVCTTDTVESSKLKESENKQ